MEYCNLAKYLLAMAIGHTLLDRKLLKKNEFLTPHIVKRKSLISKDFFLPWQWEFQQMSRSYRHFRIKCI